MSIKHNVYILYRRFSMMFFVFQVFLFAISVNESLGCFNCPSGRSLSERDVRFCKNLKFLNFNGDNIVKRNYFHSLVIWNPYIGLLEFAPRTKRLVLKKDMMETTLQKLQEYSWLLCTLVALILLCLRALPFQAWKV